LIAATRSVISPGSAANRSWPSVTRSAHVMYRSPAGARDHSLDLSPLPHYVAAHGFLRPVVGGTSPVRETDHRG
jgi:hypothetical protein